jgi:hypothetical protein
VGEVVVPLADILAGATGVGPQPPQVASYHVRKLHRWEPRGVLIVSYRLGAVVAPVGVPRQPSHHHPSAVAYPAPGRPAGRVVAEHDEAAQHKSPVVMAYPVGVPQQASHPPAAKPDAYRPLTPPPPRPAAVHAARHEEAPAPAPAPRNGGSNGLGQSGPTHVYMGPHTQIIFGGAPTTTTAGPPTRTASPARSTISPAGKKGDVNWALLNDTQGNYASAAESMSVVSPRRRKEDGWRPSVLSQSQHDTPSHRLAAASPFSSRSSSFSSPLSPYSSGSAHPSPSPSSAHSSTSSPYSSAVTKPEKILAGAKHASQTSNLPSQDNNDRNL